MTRPFSLFIGALIIALLLIGCSSAEEAVESPSPEPETATRTVHVPAGVDSASAYHADSLAEESFVSADEQDRAREIREVGQRYMSVSDTLWEYLEVSTDTTVEIDEEQEAAAIRAYNEGAQSFQEYVEVTEGEELEGQALDDMQEQLLTEAQEAFEEAISINPYDDPTRNLLAQVYALQAERLGRMAAHEEAIDILERLVRLRQDQPSLFASLANSYYETEQWSAAAENYREAREVYIESVELALEDDVELDSSRVYSYATAEADAHVYDHDAGAALETYELAMDYAITDDQREFVHEEIEWIEWDDGNIAASFARDSLSSMASEGNYADAESGFQELLGEVHTQEAQDEVEWRLAQAEFQNDNEDQAADRLQALVQRTERNEDGGPVDSTYQRYFDTYGVITYNLGQQYQGEERDLRTALQYFEQSTRVPWEQRGLAALEAGELLRNNVEESIEYLELALEHRESLDAEDQLDLYRLLVDQHRRVGDREAAREYRDMYREMADQVGAADQ